ncbi:MAG: DM13 domain-containing protein [Chloroflexota bacterium]
MFDLDDLQRALFDGLYTNRIPVLVGSILVGVAVIAIAWRLGWFGAARRHAIRTALLAIIAVAVLAPFGYYAASPLWIRTELVEPDPVAVLETPAATSEPVALTAPPTASPSTRPPTPRPTAFLARKLATGSFTGTDDFHFGNGTASIIETAPGVYHLRLDDFSVRNGPDLYVYLSTKPDDYAKGALEVGRLKATDGAFGYDLPVGTDPSEFQSAIIWCKQFSHLFAVAPFEAL